MSRRLVAPSVGFLLVLGGIAAPAAAQDAAPTPVAKAYVLVDADSGVVLAAVNHHQPYLVASLAKVMTAFVTLEQLQFTYRIDVSPLAASKPAMRIGLQPGQRWTIDDVLHSLLLVSANDAAYAMAEAAGGSIEEFARLMQRTADRLGMEDSQWLDPAGLDGVEGYGGGTTSSAYDLAILARNALEVPELAAIAAKPNYEFVGGDGKPHTLRNHNKMIGTFPGATGLKTGYTRAAGHTLIASAEREGRRLVAVVIGAAGTYDVASALLDQGFNTPTDTKGTGEVLPPTSFTRAEPPPVPEVVVEEVEEAGTGGFVAGLRRPAMVLFVMLLLAFFARREQIKRRKRRRTMMRRAYLDAKRRGMIDVIDAERYYGRRAAAHVQVMRPEEDLWPPREMQPPHAPHPAHRRGRQPSSRH